MLHSLRIFPAAVLSFLLTTLCACETAAPFQRATICRVMANPERFAGEQVKLRGWFVSDAQHYAGIEGAGCKYPFVFVESRVRALGTDALESALLTVRDGERKVRVTAIGKIDVRPGAGPRVFLIVTEYQNVEIADRASR